MIAELRVFPFEAHQPEDFRGRWAAEVLGVKATGVPKGGLSATFLRRAVAAQITLLERVAAQVMPTIGLVGRANLKPDITEYADTLQRLGFDTRRPVFKPSAKNHRSTGRPRISDLIYARVAVAYAAAAAAGRHPAPDLVRLGLSQNREAAKSMIARARKLGFLQPAAGHGRLDPMGSQPTRLAREAISAANRPVTLSPSKRSSRTATRGAHAKAASTGKPRGHHGKPQRKFR